MFIYTCNGALTYSSFPLCQCTHTYMTSHNRQFSFESRVYDYGVPSAELDGEPNVVS